MNQATYIATVLPHVMGDDIFYLSAETFLSYYRRYSQMFRQFMDQYYTLSLSFCTEIYASNQHLSFPQEWKKDMEVIYSTPDLLLGILELRHSTLAELESKQRESQKISASLLQFFSLARDLSFSREKCRPLTDSQCDKITQYIKEISKTNALFTGCARKKATEVLLLSIAVDALTGRKGVIGKTIDLIKNADSSVSSETCEYLLRKARFFEDIRQQLTTYSGNPSVPCSAHLTELDFGAGRGYYSVFRSIELEARLIAIEGSLSHTGGLSSYVSKLRAVAPAHSKAPLDLAQYENKFRISLLFVDENTTGEKIDSISMPIASLITNMNKIKAAFDSKHIQGSVIQGAKLPCLSVTESINPIMASTTSSSNNTARKYCAIGLHACGPLSVITLQMLLQKDVHSAFTVPCCYGHLTKGTFPFSSLGSNIITAFFSDPTVRGYFKEYHADVLPREFLTYAASDCVFDWQEVQETVCSYRARATVELARRMLSPDNVLAKRPLEKSLRHLLKEIGAGKNEDENLMALVTADLNLAPVNTASDHTEKEVPCREEIAKAAIRKVTEDAWAIQAHYLVRKVSGRVFETFILMDRLAGIIERTQRASQPICAGILPVLTEVSARGFMIWGLNAQCKPC